MPAWHEWLQLRCVTRFQPVPLHGLLTGIETFPRVDVLNVVRSTEPRLVDTLKLNTLVGSVGRGATRWLGWLCQRVDICFALP